MADWYPGAWRVELGGNGNRITYRPAENVLHIAASNWNVGVRNGIFYPNEQSNPSWGIAGWNSGARACQTYNDQFGNMQQYCSLYSAVNGTKNGNYRCRTHEAWNPEGLTGTDEQYNSSTYTPEQCERFSDFLAFDYNENGALLQDMGDSRPSSHGCACHRYGIDPWRVSGGEVWTARAGKVCPGTARVRQLPGIIERARVIAAAVRAGKCSYLPPGRVDVRFALARTGNAPGPNPNPIPEEDEDSEMYHTYQPTDGPDSGGVWIACPGFFEPLPSMEYYNALVLSGAAKPVKVVSYREFDIIRDSYRRFGPLQAQTVSFVSNTPYTFADAVRWADKNAFDAANRTYDPLTAEEVWNYPHIPSFWTNQDGSVQQSAADMLGWTNAAAERAAQQENPAPKS